ncbi:hypothetical protein ACRALDRAFT_2038456 [Sodiomyces alcalophilus JCM 7366]|uniref:uncharacterized protein n=1 Tax=Sodiomyces alcalophilus JCM 7366 TaxID=591952 RepID=UPI0039B5A06D
MTQPRVHPRRYHPSFPNFHATRVRTAPYARESPEIPVGVARLTAEAEAEAKGGAGGSARFGGGPGPWPRSAPGRTRSGISRGASCGRRGRRGDTGGVGARDFTAGAGAAELAVVDVVNVVVVRLLAELLKLAVFPATAIWLIRLGNRASWTLDNCLPL